MSVAELKRGDVVRYAESTYVVLRRNGDLLVLSGIASVDRIARPHCTVLGSDVTPTGRWIDLDGEEA